MVARHWREEEATVESLERENAQLKAVIAEQKEVIERLSVLADKWNTECDEMREDNKRLDAVGSEQSALIETLAAALIWATNSCKRKTKALQQYELWKESK
jgi:predicted RNase H-like nuclease (RuvC/YqgF family)